MISTLSVVSFSNAREKARVANGMAFSSQMLRSNGDDLVTNFSFDECASTVYDQSETEATGSFQNEASASTDTPNGKGCSVLLDGVNDYVSVSKGGALANRSYTMSAWLQRGSFTSSHIAIALGSVNAQQEVFYLGFYVDDKFRCGTFSWNNSIVTTEMYTDTKWRHYACAFDASTNIMSLYVDGVLKKQGTTVPFIGTDTVNIGRTNHGSSFFPGRIDDVRIYTRALTSEEIRKVYAETSAKFFANVK